MSALTPVQIIKQPNTQRKIHSSLGSYSMKTDNFTKHLQFSAKYLDPRQNKSIELLLNFIFRFLFDKRK
jgi:hypothetical protein